MIDDLWELEAKQKLPEDFAPEWKMAMKLFCNTPLCFEFQASSRFKDPCLRNLMSVIREPGKRIPADIASSWASIHLREGDERLQEDRFQSGHMIAIYW